MLIFCPQLDMTDACQNFTRVVPQQAFESPILFHAIIALSARLCKSFQDYNIEISECHHQECLLNLIPVLGDQGLASDGKVLAATVILRMYEMLKSCKSGVHSALHGTCAISLYRSRKAGF